MGWGDGSSPVVRPARAGERVTVGVLVDWLDDSYQNTMVCGLADAARERDVNLLVFSGGILGAPGGDGQHRNFVFDLCGPPNVDAIVILSGALGNHLGPASVEELVKRWRPMPMVSVAIAIPGIPSLLVDEALGMRQALDHLVTRHGCRSIAFIRGPAVNAEAERRYALYREVLAEHGLPDDPALVCEGTFQATAGKAAIAELIDQRKVTFDAMVASNDYMALAAIAELQRRGLQVPADVAVIGFDDLEDDHFATPPLTTVRQPLYQQSALALELVLAQLQGRQVAAETLLATELITRQSCGCFSQLARPARSGPVTRTSTTIDALLSDHGEQLCAQMANAVHDAAASLDSGWTRQLLDAFEAGLRGAGAGLFTATLDRLLAQVVAAGDDVATWQGLISALRKLLLPALENEPLRWNEAEDLWHEARMLIGDFAERAQAQHRLRSERVARTLIESSATLLAIQQVPSLIRAIGEQLPALGIPAAWLALFEGEGESTTARLALVHDDARQTMVLPHLTYPIRELLPAEARPTNRRSTLMVVPLFFQEQRLGYIVLEMGPRDGLVYESLAEQISGALQGARLVRKLFEEGTRLQVAERQALDKEIGIAARMQTSILPRHISIPGLEIAASMLTGSEVGGDYYDVIPVDGGCWIGIGDVAGHGLNAGLVTLMIQSGLGALARKLPEAAPRELVLAVNAMLVDNVRARLGQSEHATLTLFRYWRDGSLVFAGGHEEILIFRARTGRCERLATPGPWVAAKRDISNGLVDSAARLEDGDLLVLYTDGVIEATNSGREQLGLDAVIAEIEQRHELSAAEIRDAVIARVTAFSPILRDDVTVLVARYRASAAARRP